MSMSMDPWAIDPDQTDVGHVPSLCFLPLGLCSSVLQDLMRFSTTRWRICLLGKLR